MLLSLTLSASYNLTVWSTWSEDFSSCVVDGDLWIDLKLPWLTLICEWIKRLNLLLRLLRFFAAWLFFSWLLSKLLRLGSFLYWKIFLNLILIYHTRLNPLNFFFVISLKALQPRVLEEISGTWSVISFEGEELAKEVFCFIAETFLNLWRELVVGSANLVVEFFVCGTSVWELPRQNSK